MVRLITHNLLACHVKDCAQSSNNFPLQFKDVKIEVREAEFNAAFLKGFMPRIEWKALVDAAKQVSFSHISQEADADRYFRSWAIRPCLQKCRRWWTMSF